MYVYSHGTFSEYEVSYTLDLSSTRFYKVMIRIYTDKSVKALQSAVQRTHSYVTELENTLTQQGSRK